MRYYYEIAQTNGIKIWYLHPTEGPIIMITIHISEYFSFKVTQSVVWYKKQRAGMFSENVVFLQKHIKQLEIRDHNEVPHVEHIPSRFCGLLQN